MDYLKPEKEADGKGISRRKFVGGIAAAAGVTLVPRHVLGGRGYQAPSDTLNIATIGAGGMGRNNTERCALTENIVALCDVDDNRGARVYRSFHARRRT
ncbi:MAG TPA: hypothetical protein PLP42_18790, partial [Acidobacteriota bacterium]|nr:hypothetical protein [Acidobacteriota bacterium]